MTVREKIGKYPLWKAAIIFLLSFTILAVTIEEIFVSRVFNIIGKSISYFEKEKNQEMDEWGKDKKLSEDFDKKWKQGFDDVSKNFDEASKKIKQSQYCLDYLNIQEAREYLAKHKNDSKNLVQLSWEKDANEQYQRNGKSQTLIDLEKAIKNKEFDPATCHRGSV